MAQRWLPIILLLCIGAVVFFSGLNWGLPSHRVDPYLFGDHPVWTGQQILSLLPKDENADRGADVAAEPIVNRDVPVLLNATDQQRAEIIRRYRLFSYQPDEMITFMSLSRMNPHSGDFDPRLYQYGSLWIYPVGGLLKICSLLHLIQLRPDMAYYLDHPAQFGKFYIVARAYSAAWALFGILVVFELTGALGGDLSTQAIAALGFIFLPVVIYTSHEAKPHLPGAVLSLLAVLMGLRFLETGRWRYAIFLILSCGLACSMVISTFPLLLLIPTVFALKGPRMAIRAIGGVIAAVIIYLLLNPYLWIDFFWHRQRLVSNLSNSAAMYHFSFLSAFSRAVGLTADGTSLIVFIFGIVGAIALLITGRTRTWILVAASLFIWIPFAVFAANKPAEYGRFAIL
ncbi:MAG TPA: hypothetical protein VG722_04405, partial [Tepidisphaeraceae bacterium]|nr:hypothetical protein [Tepidisphaeraceae bacterium]